MAQALTAQRVRLDKWLWAARFFKTRSLAAEAAVSGRVDVNGQPAKPARELHPGDEVRLRRPGGPACTVVVLGLSAVRGPAPVAQALYRETPESISARQQAEQARAQGVEPALGRREGRPTGRDRRQLAHWQRWSASLDD
ncbi:MAG: ribosome-associated heat shock protein Hsp15, HslR [Pseudomonadota bacterium]